MSDLPPAPPITGVAEIVLNVKSLPAMRDFYTSVLGFPVFSEACIEEVGVDNPDGQPTITFLTISQQGTPLGATHPQLLALIDYQRHAHAKGRIKGHNQAESPLNHLAFEIPPDSFDAHQQRLQELGLNPIPTEFPAMNAVALFFQDPEENRLELICRNPILPPPEEEPVESIQLDKFLKMADLVASGGEAKHIIRSSHVSVNGETETRRGRKLVPGDVVTFRGEEYVIDTD